VFLTEVSNIPVSDRKREYEPLRTALRYFISLISSYVGLRVSPTFDMISSLRRARNSGCIANKYIADVNVEAV
jgi:hypothetical protein